MSEVRAPLATGRSVDATDFGDLTPARVVSVRFDTDGLLVVEFDRDVTPGERAAVERRIMSRTPHEEVLRGEAAEYLTVTDPDSTAIRAQVELLTEIVLGRTTLEETTR